MDLLVDFILNFYGPTPYFIVFLILMLCGVGLPIPEDIILLAAGLLAFYGVTQVWLMIAVSLLGVVIGDSLIFYLGSHYGRRLTKQWLFHRLLPDDRLEWVRRQFEKRGDRLLFAARFMPGFRAPMFFSAGTLHVPYRKFLIYDGGAALISVPAIIGAVYYFGDQLDVVVGIVKRVEHGILFVIVAALLAILAKWYITHRKVSRTEQ